MRRLHTLETKAVPLQIVFLFRPPTSSYHQSPLHTGPSSYVFLKNPFLFEHFPLRTATLLISPLSSSHRGILIGV
jgi:hypothetical protein